MRLGRRRCSLCAPHCACRGPPWHCTCFARLDAMLLSHSQSPVARLCTRLAAAPQQRKSCCRIPRARQPGGTSAEESGRILLLPAVPVPCMACVSVSPHDAMAPSPHSARCSRVLTGAKLRSHDVLVCVCTVAHCVGMRHSTPAPQLAGTPRHAQIQFCAQRPPLSPASCLPPVTVVDASFPEIAIRTRDSELG